jgi:transposase
VEVQAESERPAVQPSAKTKRQHPGRQELPANLPRVERILACTPEQCVCQGCGKQTTVIGYEESSQLDVEPAKYFVLVSKREKRTCKAGEEKGVISAPLPPRIIEKCLASDQIVITPPVRDYLAAVLPGLADLRYSNSQNALPVLGPASIRSPPTVPAYPVSKMS